MVNGRERRTRCNTASHSDKRRDVAQESGRPLPWRHLPGIEGLPFRRRPARSL